MKDAKANCQQSANSCTCSEGDGEWQNGRKGHPIAAQLAIEMVPLIGAPPPPVLLVVAGGRTDTTLTAAMAAAAAAVMTMVARVTVAAARARNAGREADVTGAHLRIAHSLRIAHAGGEPSGGDAYLSAHACAFVWLITKTNTPDLFCESWLTLSLTQGPARSSGYIVD